MRLAFFVFATLASVGFAAGRFAPPQEIHVAAAGSADQQAATAVSDALPTDR
ncbi:hypothetical protein [Arenibaculum pallidiluteum]|uniref:hypothetical protein n=1 Tax=Arenibaculum pallidiluteum TaxID=2812559 RepID=UPI001A97901E|nr:hypothetical protein [Arenibaculum pallidiluteum]